MGFQCGIVGLPNVGKSTLFNALTASSAAAAANYPFCTIEPNTGIVPVPDPRLFKLAEMVGSAKTIPTHIEFVDIAGLVKGASQGEGLGNQFLSHIRQVDAIIHVLRCFDDADITHVHGKVDPINDAEVIETELILADLESVERRVGSMEKKYLSGDKSLLTELEALRIILKTLSEGKPAKVIPETDIDAKLMASFQLLSSKPTLYVCNVLEDEAATGNEHTQKIAAKAKAENAEYIVISSKIEAEISLLETDEEKQEFLDSLGLKETGLNQVIRAGYDLLNLQSYFTVGPKEARGWTFTIGTLAPGAAGIIHTDFEKGFIRAEVIKYDDYVELGNEVKIKEAGKMRLEGKEYVMQDGDVVHFRFNV